MLSIVIRVPRQRVWFTTRPEQPSLVTWELEEVPGGCRGDADAWRLDGSGEDTRERAGGWNGILDLLKLEMETGDIPFRTKATYGLMKAFRFMLPESTRAEEVTRAGW